jgi:hypothetical protein
LGVGAGDRRVETARGRAGEGDVDRQGRCVRPRVVEIENQIGRGARRDQQAAYRGERARKHAAKVDCLHSLSDSFCNDFSAASRPQ